MRADIADIRQQLTIKSVSAHDSVLESIWALNPILIMLLMTVPGYNILYEHGKDHRPWMKLCAVGSQWFWTVQLSSSLSHLVTDCYLVRSDGLRTGQVRVLEPDNNLILPYNRWLRLLISAVAVIHSFGVHSLGLKFDGIPGRLSSS